MLSIARGYDVGYLTGPVSAGREGYYTGAVAAGEPAGRWYGAGADGLGLRGDVDADLMEAIYKHLLDPRDAATHSRETWDTAEPLAHGHRAYRSADVIYQELIEAEDGAGPERRQELRAQAEKSARQAVAFLDVTFSAPKSVTVLGASFERMANDARKSGDDTAGEAWSAHQRAVEEAVMAGARASLDYLQDVAGYSRVGHHGGGAGRWIDAHSFIAAQFLQHDSRDKDPQLHVHQAILNRVQCSDGQWRTLDSRAVTIHRMSAGVIGERVMEAHLARTLGVRFETRPDGVAREVAGVSQDVQELFSSRSRAITDKTAELVAAYTERHGRAPSVLERKHIAQEATLATRKGKSHHGETLEDRLDRWEQEARQAVGAGLAEVAREALAQGAAGTGEPAVWSPEDVITRAIDAAGQNLQTWTRSDLMWSISNALPANLHIPAEDIRPLLEKLTDLAEARAIVTKKAETTEDLPAQFLLANGKSSFQAPGGEKFTASGQIVAERMLQEAAVRTGAVALTLEQANAVLSRYAENGRELGADQAGAVRGVLTSGAHVEVIAAAAGAGKSFTVGGIAEVWAEHGHKTFGLTPTQKAANILTKEGVAAWNLAAWRGAQERLDASRGSADDAALALREGDLVTVDEAGMAATADLAYVAQRCEKAGAKLLLVGDARQLAAVGPGGALSDIGAKAASYELTEVRRFRESWEAEASLRLRDADRSAIDQYDKHGRLHAQSTPEDAQQAAERAWLGDMLAGKNSLLLVSSNEAANQMSARMRAELVRLGKVEEVGVPLGWDGNTAGVGDTVRARRNAWNLRGYDGNERAPVNQDTYRVVESRPDGSLRVAPVLGWDGDGEQLGNPLTLPSEYVADHLSLSYASTLYAAQGCTVDTSHTVVTAGSAASDVYVGMTRGREENHAWISTQPVPSDAPVGEAQNVEPRAARAVFGEVLDRAEEQRGALAEQAQDVEDDASTFRNVDRLIYGIAELTAGRTSKVLDRLTAAGAITPEQRQELAADQAMGSVERLLRHAEVSGHDPDEVLRGALDGKSLDGVRSPAQVLHARLRNNLGDLAPRINSYRDLIPASVTGRDRIYLEHHADKGDDRRRELGSRVAAAKETPKWAVDTLGAVPADPLARVEWEHRAGWAAAHRENMTFDDEAVPLGVAPPAGLAEKHAVWWTAHDALDLPDISPADELLSDGRHRARWAAYQRDLTWAPKYVGDELAATSEMAAARKTDAALWAARADALPAGDEAAKLRQAAAEAKAEAEVLTQQVTALEEADKVRARYFAHTAVTRDLGERSKVVLESRGHDVENPPDLVTTEAWLAAHRDDQVREDPWRQIHDTDLDASHEAAAVDEAHPLVETAVPDIREVSTPDPSESTDPDPIRQVPDADQTAASVARAREALLELNARGSADKTREEDHLAEHVAWWAEDQHDANTEEAVVRSMG